MKQSDAFITCLPHSASGAPASSEECFTGLPLRLSSPRQRWPSALWEGQHSGNSHRYSGVPRGWSAGESLETVSVLYSSASQSQILPSGADGLIPLETGPDQQRKCGVRRHRYKKWPGGSTICQETHRLLHRDKDPAREGKKIFFSSLKPVQMRLSVFCFLILFMEIPLRSLFFICLWADLNLLSCLCASAGSPSLWQRKGFSHSCHPASWHLWTTWSTVGSNLSGHSSQGQDEVHHWVCWSDCITSNGSHKIIFVKC